MKKIALSTAASIALVSIPQVALANNFSSYVASNGQDSNPCTRSQPCQTLQHAHDQTAANGRIVVVDPGDYGALTISKSITIVSEPLADTVSPGGAGLSSPNVTISAGPQDIVTLIGLTVDGVGVIGSGLQAIHFATGGKLYIHNCIIKNWGMGAGKGGLLFAPSGASYLVVTNTIFSQNTGGSSGSGILIQPTGSGSARVSIERTVAEGNGFGIVADGTGSSGGINMTIVDSVATGNINDGILAVTPTGGAPVGITVTNTRSTNNGFGLRSLGPNVTIRADRTTAVGNSTGLTFGSGGALLTYGNNAVNANGSDGTFSGPVAPQ